MILTGWPISKKKQQWKIHVTKCFDPQSAQKSRHKWDAYMELAYVGPNSHEILQHWGLFSYQHHFPWGWENDPKFWVFFASWFLFSLPCRERSHVTRQRGKGKSCWKDTLGGDMLVFGRVAICLFEDLWCRVDIVRYIRSQITCLFPFQIILAESTCAIFVLSKIMASQPTPPLSTTPEARPYYKGFPSIRPS